MLSATGIKTDIGNRILHTLVQSGWRVDYAYPDTMIDKGVDFDRYKISKAAESLEFEWDNWEEWQICGTPDAMLRICVDFGVSLDQR